MTTGLELLKLKSPPQMLMPQCSEGALSQPRAYETPWNTPTGKMMTQITSHSRKQTTMPPDWGFDTRILSRIYLKLYKSIYMYRKKESQNVANDCTEVAKLWLNF